MSHTHAGTQDPETELRRHTKFILYAEFSDLDLDEFPGVELEFVKKAQLNDFYVFLKPEYGLYYRAKLKFHVVVPVGYPHVMPRVTAETLIYHPNVNRTNADVPLSGWWGKEEGFIGLRRLLAYLIVIMRAPDVVHPVNFPATLLIESNLRQFEENVERALKGEVVDGVQYPKLIE